VIDEVLAGSVVNVSFAPPEVAENRRPAELAPKKILVAEVLVVGFELASSRVTVTGLVADVDAGAVKGADVMTSLAPGPGVTVSLSEPEEPA